MLKRQFFKPYAGVLLTTLSGYSVILVGLLVFALQLSQEIDDFTAQTNKLYQHPFQVNAAARISRQAVSTLRAELLYAVIDQSIIEHNKINQERHKQQVALNDSLTTIEANFLGDMSQVYEARSLVNNLHQIHSQIFSLLANQDITAAEDLIKSKATPMHESLLKRMDYIVDYSSNKAADLVAQAKERRNESKLQLWLLLIVFALFTLFSGTVTATIVLRSLYRRDIILRETNENLRVAATAFEAQEGMMITNAENKILRVNSAFTKVTEYQAADVIGQDPNVLSSGKHDLLFYEQMWREINHDGYWEGEIWNQRKTGEIYPQKLTITAVKDGEGEVCNYVSTLNDITRNKEAEKKIADLAYFDPLTRLPNRRLLLDRLHHALATSSRNGHEGALLFLDLDHFKTLNDTLGHDMGDLLLQQVAIRLQKCIRESDTVARFGGDEFVIIIEGLSVHGFLAAAQVEDISNKILNSVNAPYDLAGQAYKTSTSIGITLFNRQKTAAEELLKQADIALYQAKEDGRNSMKFFDPQMQANISARAVLEEELHLAVERQQFELYYQVQMSQDNIPLGAEALIRWNHPQRGLVSPLEFIPLAEQNGSIVEIGQWVLKTACRQLQAWQQHAATKELTLSINVSAKQFHQDSFVRKVRAAVNRFAINPRLLKLELTESLLLDNIENTIAKMRELSMLGIQFSLDDFGTGYSSLQYLKQLPLYQLKIDKSFVDDLVTDDSDQEIVRTIIAMAHSLGLSVIAEGVETEQQQLRLYNEGCTYYQGYLFGRPETLEAYELRVKKIHKAEC
ncbi:putative bifunctional diguanylate cyclase/phosphodiesterase [Shewanella gelidii]|uniref:cyclic-guanylate-specific phosphodiesterase n=1 Tax=Shewanella gelidii TaxID=1642821 RepID=A0A917NC57_9GAMM|nr:GGDEF and EAL domain-containing protein [Shewanella gelidii]MCL1098800.1 EAL domain-containing protein [Shewanella gelidii]GGI87597.1 hypothetical protein GCM10009332_26070 [Shewanella gelidii]